MLSLLRRTKPANTTTFIKHLATTTLTTPSEPSAPTNPYQFRPRSLSLRHLSKGTTTSDYDHIRAAVNCPRCSSQWPVLFSNRRFSITGREPGVFQAVNACLNCRTAFYFRPFKLEPLQGSFIELGRVKGFDNGSGGGGGGGAGSDSDCASGGRTEGNKDVENEKGWRNVEEGRLEEELPTPKEICRGLDEFVIGQDKGKKVLAVAVYNHYKRVHHTSRQKEKYGFVALLGLMGCTTSLGISLLRG